MIRDMPTDNLMHSRIKNFDIDFCKNFPHFEGKSDLIHLNNKELLTHFIRMAKFEGFSYNRFFYLFIDLKFL